MKEEDVRKVSIIGVGAVGVDICHHIIAWSDCQELVLVDLNRDKARAEQMDFSHGTALAFAKNIEIIAGDYEDTAESDIIVIAGGATLKPSAKVNRLDLADINSKIAVDIANQAYRYSPRAIVIVVTNPCDILAYFIVANTPYKPQQVISAGCIIDSARLKTIIAERVKIDPKNIFAMVWGEHGSGSFIPWSKVQIAGQPIDEYCEANGLPIFAKKELLKGMIKAGMDIFVVKANTNHGIAASVYRLIRAIANNECSVLPVGVLLQGEYGISGVVVNVPVVIGAKGIERILRYELEPEELENLQETAGKLREVTVAVAAHTGLKTLK